VLCDIGFRRSGSEEPVACRARVGHGFERGKGFGGDEEEGFVGGEVADGFGEVGAVNVGDEAEGEVALRVVLEGFVCHHRAEIGAADADVDDVADGLTGVAFPVARTDAFGEGGHLVEDFVDLGNDIFSIDKDGFGLRRAESDVEDGAVFGDVDLLAGEHGFGALAQAGLFGELLQQAEGFVGDAVLGVVEKKSCTFHRKTRAAVGVGGEELAEMGFADRVEVGLKSFPGWSAGQRNCLLAHVVAFSC